MRCYLFTINGQTISVRAPSPCAALAIALVMCSPSFIKGIDSEFEKYDNRKAEKALQKAEAEDE